MQITFNCAKCGTQMEAASDLFGSQSNCPHCETPLIVPGAKVEPGTRIAGFEILRRIGRGAMGEVFMAQQLAMDRIVALKILPAEFSRDEQRIERFLHEARMAAKLEHPNIVTVMDAGEDTGFYFLAMSYVEGETLERRQKRLGKFEEREALHIMAKVAAGLAVAWERHHMLHRDIKPANIMVDNYGEPKLLDMGLAKTLLEDKKMTVTGMIVGTPLYMSPEQARSDGQLDCRADIYSLGATLYHLLTGAPPYHAESVIGIIAKHALDPFPDPLRRNSEITPQCVKLLELMMGKKPEARQPNWRAVIADLHAVLNGEMPGDWSNLSDVALPSSGVTSTPGGRLRTGTGIAPQAQPQVLEVADSGGRGMKPLVLALVFGALAGLLLVAALIAPKLWSKRNAAVPVAAVTPPGGPLDGNVVSLSQTTSTSATDQTATAVVAPIVPAQPHVTAAAVAPEIDNLLADAKNYLRAHPDSHDSVIALLDGLRPSVAGTPFAGRVEQAIADVREGRTNAIARVEQRLRDSTAAQVAAGQTAQAITTATQYDGPWAFETSAARADLARDLIATRDAATAAATSPASTPATPDTQTAPTPTTANDIMLAAAGDVLRGDTMAARKRLADAQGEARFAADSELFRQARQVIDQLDQVPNAILASFLDDKGKEVSVELNGGAKSLEVSELKGDTLIAREVVRQTSADGRSFTGRLPHNITYADLSPRERLKRLGRGTDPWRILTRGQWALQANQSETAAKLFGQAGTPLGTAMQGALAQHLENVAEAAVVADLKTVLDATGLGFDTTATPYRVFAAWMAAAPVDVVRQRAQTAAERYLDAHPDGALTDTWGGLIQVLAGVYTPPMGLLPLYRATLPSTDGLNGGADEAQRLVNQVARQHKLPIAAVNSVGIRFQLVPNGLRNQPISGQIREAYYISAYEITEGQWAAVTGRRRGANRPDYPVEDVDWSDVEQFCSLLSQQEKTGDAGYRVPSRAEWYYAAYPVTVTPADFYFGGDATRMAEYGNFLDRTAPEVIGGWQVGPRRSTYSDGHSRLGPIGQYRPNAYGLYDVLGNCMEYAYVAAPHDLMTGRMPLANRAIAAQMASGELSILLGGSWYYTTDELRTSATIGLPYSQMRALVGDDGVLRGIGLRLMIPAFAATPGAATNVPGGMPGAPGVPGVGAPGMGAPGVFGPLPRR